jgi:hypothetical protein
MERRAGKGHSKGDIGNWGRCGEEVDRTERQNTQIGSSSINEMYVRNLEVVPILMSMTEIYTKNKSSSSRHRVEEG